MNSNSGRGSAGATPVKGTLSFLLNPSDDPVEKQPSLQSSHVKKHPSSSSNATTSSEKPRVRKKRERSFTCTECRFRFYTNSDLRKHYDSVHLMLRPFECSGCGKMFGERSNATKHVHERQRNAACDKCDKVFAFRDGLVRHVRLVHENVRNFHCLHPGCGQSFKQSAHLKKHDQVHARGKYARKPGSGGGASGSSSKTSKSKSA